MGIKEFFVQYQFFFYYLIIINVITFIMFGIDKYKAIKNKWRIKESTLLGLTFIGGTLGSMMGMYVFRHKTKKFYFFLGIPFMMILHVALFVYLVFGK